MLLPLTLLIWDGNYVVIDEAPSSTAILAVDPLMQYVCELIEGDYIACTAYHLQVDTEDESLSEDDMYLIADNLASMLNDDTLVILARYEFRLEGQRNRGMGISQHALDIKRYYDVHPFIA